MKKLKFLVLLLFIVSFSISAYSQLWKQYSDSAKAFNDQKKTDKAIEYYIKAKEELPRDSVWTNSHVRICNSLANLYRNMGQYEKAEPLYIEAKNLREKILGKENPDYASSCNNLAVLYTYMAQYEKAEIYYFEAKNIREKALGKEHPDYGSSCNNLAVLYTYMGQYEKAEIYYLEAKKVREKALGKENPFYAETSNNLAVLYWNMGHFEKVEPLYIESKNIRERVMGKEHPDYAASCNNLAILYVETGQFKKAEPLYLEAKKIREKALGTEHPDYAQSCNNLASLYRIEGKYEKAEPLYVETMLIREKLLGKEHPDYAGSCSNLANFYSDLGQYEKAEHLYLEAKQIREKALGKEHPDYASSCNNLADFYNDMGQYKKAEPLYAEARQIREKVLGKEHPDYASSCDNLAVLYMDIGEYGKAEPLYVEAKNIREKALGKEHPEYASSCANLANFYSDLGQYEKAEPLYLEAKQIREKALGKEHPEYASNCKNLANLYRNIDQYEKAEAYYVEALHLHRAQIQKIFKFTSEAEKQSYLQVSKANNNDFFSFTYSNSTKSRQELTYDASLSNRNLILSSTQQLRQAIYNSSDTSIRNKYSTWMSAREQIAFWHAKPIDDRPVYVKVLEEQANTLEKELTRLSPDFNKEQSNNEIIWKNIQQSLKEDEAAIEFKEFNYFDGRRWTDSTYYIALVLRKNKTEPELVQLFEKKQLDSLLKYKKTSPGQQRLNVLYSVEEATGNKYLKKSLYDFIWKPLEEKLKGINTVYYSPAGSLYKIAFAALPVNNKEVLSDKYQLVQLNTTASVVGQLPVSISASDNIILYGGVQYDADSMSIKKAALQYNHNDVATRSLPEGLLREGVSDFYFLKGSEQEVIQIEKLANQNKYSAVVSNGMMATEESFKSLSGKNSPAVLHIATHGFFFPDPKNEKKDKRVSGAVVFKQSDNPLIRSGLALAGANNAWKGNPVTGVEDGILTSYEVSNMYLPNCKLVVLSACETGLGDIQGSEGVYGLQRAFKMATVQNLLMSLWKVDDKAASEFMQLFYKNLFTKQTIANAFYNAQAFMKNKYRNDPYKWAAWVLVR